jgi:hypothetical protein
MMHETTDAYKERSDMSTRVRVWPLPHGNYSDDFNLLRFRKAQKGKFSAENEKRAKAGATKGAEERCKAASEAAGSRRCWPLLWREDGDEEE